VNEKIRNAVDLDWLRFLFAIAALASDDKFFEDG